MLSSVGRAVPLQGTGQWFEPASTYQFRSLTFLGSTMLNTRLIIRALEEHKKGLDPLKDQNQISEIDATIKLITTPLSRLALMGESGPHFKVARTWIQENALNGSDVYWGLDTNLRFATPITSHCIEMLACEVAASYFNNLMGLK